MGLGEETSQKIYLAGALHDIGKVAIGNDILEKPDKLTDCLLYTSRIAKSIRAVVSAAASKTDKKVIVEIDN